MVDDVLLRMAHNAHRERCGDAYFNRLEITEWPGGCGPEDHNAASFMVVSTGSQIGVRETIRTHGDTLREALLAFMAAVGHPVALPTTDRIRALVASNLAAAPPYPSIDHIRDVARFDSLAAAAMLDAIDPAA
jgi:hypothetical protein